MRQRDIGIEVQLWHRDRRRQNTYTARYIKICRHKAKSKQTGTDGDRGKKRQRQEETALKAVIRRIGPTYRQGSHRRDGRYVDRFRSDLIPDSAIRCRCKHGALL